MTRTSSFKLAASGMLVRRKGLSVRVDHAALFENGDLETVSFSFSYFLQKSIRHFNDQKVIGGIDNKENSGIPLRKTAKAPSLSVYKDNTLTFCQHCGTKNSEKPQVKSSVSTQTTETSLENLKEMLSAGKVY